jgi:putative tricarboxylic transport membrane protein
VLETGVIADGGESKGNATHLAACSILSIITGNTTLPFGLSAGFRICARAASVFRNPRETRGTGEEMGKYNLRNGDVVSGALLAALGLYIVTQASAWNYYSFDGPGPGFFPIWYGLLMIGLALALIVTTALKPKPEETKRNFVGTSRAFITWLAFAACVAVMGMLGFRVAFALFTFFIVKYIFQRSPTAAALTAIAAAAAFHITFSVLLGVQLPTGWFGF